MSQKTLFTLLFFSLAANLLVAGFLIGRSLQGHGSGQQHGTPPRGEITMQRLGRFLPPEERRAVGSELRQRAPAFRQIRRERRMVEEQIRTLLRAETLDEAALAAALDRHTALTGELQGFPKEMLRLVAPRLDQESRARIADRVFRGRRAR